MSMEAYRYDATLRPATKKKMVDRLQRRFAYSERDLYGLKGAPEIEWLELNFDEKMSFTYKDHYKMMDRKRKIDHVVHKKWKEVYDKDPVMDDDWNTALQRLINEKFSQSLFEAEDDPDPKHCAAMIDALLGRGDPVQDPDLQAPSSGRLHWVLPQDPRGAVQERPRARPRLRPATPDNSQCVCVTNRPLLFCINTSAPTVPHVH